MIICFLRVNKHFPQDSQSSQYKVTALFIKLLLEDLLIIYKLVH